MTDRLSLHELNFLADGERIANVRAAAVPPVGSIVQIARVDYIVTKVFWAVDQRNGISSLRAIIDMEKAPPTQSQRTE